MTSWITLYPDWYVSERNAIQRAYPDLRADEAALRNGVLWYFGELVVRPPGGAKRHSVAMLYPAGTPYELPIVLPLESLPEFDETGVLSRMPGARVFDRRHQMPGGGLCLFQRETRGAEGGETIRGPDVMHRAEQWFLGLHTGRWPPDSVQSELEPHFQYAGDILLSETFYRDEIHGFGKFYMVRDLNRFFDGVSTEDPPLIVTVITKAGGVEAVFDARTDLQNIYPWLSNDAWSPAKLIELEERTKNDTPLSLATEHGFWWSLPAEPLPFHDGAGLLRELQAVAQNDDAWSMLSDAVGGQLTYASHFFGFRYPGRAGRDEWLILFMPRQCKTTAGGAVVILTPDEKRRTFERAPIACYRVHGARPIELRLRNTSVVSPTVENKSVALVGLGALGSKVAELLVQAGVGEVRLCDTDRLTPGNAARHLGGVKDFGAKKTRVVMTRLFDINPRLRISEVRNDSAVSSLDGLIAFLEPADVTVCTTADENVESSINQVAVMQKKTVVYGRALRRGSVGRVFLVRPREDPCKTCLGYYASQARAGKAPPSGWVDVPESDDDILLHECGRPVIPASAIDLSFVAALTARVTLDILQGNPTEDNHWLWSSRPVTDAALSNLHPLGTVSARLDRFAGCPVCQEPDVVGVVLREDAREAIVAEVESTPSTETGGILLGFVDQDRHAVVIRATGPGPEATKSAGGFDRDIEFVQGELQKAASELGNRGLYVGEWHSHLDADPEPSGIDISSLCGIAKASNYATRCPVLLIAGLEVKTGRVAKLKTWSFPIGGPVYPVEHTVARSDESQGANL